MALDIGKVGMIMKGAWDSSATYEVLDAVSYNNGLYVAKQAVPANTLPTNTTYWQCAVDGSDLSDDISLTFSEGITAAFKEAFKIENRLFVQMVLNSVSLPAYTWVDIATMDISVSSEIRMREDIGNITVYCSANGNKLRMFNVGDSTASLSNVPFALMGTV